MDYNWDNYFHCMLYLVKFKVDKIAMYYTNVTIVELFMYISLMY